MFTKYLVDSAVVTLSEDDVVHLPVVGLVLFLVHFDDQWVNLFLLFKLAGLFELAERDLDEVVAEVEAELVAHLVEILVRVVFVVFLVDEFDLVREDEFGHPLAHAVLDTAKEALLVTLEVFCRTLLDEFGLELRHV